MLIYIMRIKNLFVEVIPEMIKVKYEGVERKRDLEKKNKNKTQKTKQKKNRKK